MECLSVLVVPPEEIKETWAEAEIGELRFCVAIRVVTIRYPHDTISTWICTSILAKNCKMDQLITIRKLNVVQAMSPFCCNFRVMD